VQEALLRDIDDVLDARRRRIFLGQVSMSPIMWLIIGAGAVITIGFAAMFPMRRVSRQIAVMSLAAVMFAMMIFLVVAMDRPLRGELSVQPDAFRLIKSNIARLMQEK
jgi:formate/nitrite transporter FocA (FNT family)